MTDERTTELREKLDSLSIEHFDYDKGGRTQTQWEAPDGKRHFTYETSDNPAKTARLVIAWHPTPEQAIAATLGEPGVLYMRGQTEIEVDGQRFERVKECELEHHDTGWVSCRECNTSWKNDRPHVYRRCPYCGAKVVKTDD